MMMSQIRSQASAARRRAGGDKGFTLVELMVVVLVIAILLAIAIPTFLGARERSQDRAAQSNLRNALTAAKVVFSNDGDYQEAAHDDLDEIEPRLQYVAHNAVSTAEKTISVDTPVGKWATIAGSNGLCFDNATGVTNGTAVGSTTCTAGTQTWLQSFCFTMSSTTTVLQPAYTAQAPCEASYALWSAAVWSESETCFYIYDDAEAEGASGGTGYGSNSDAVTCQAFYARHRATSDDW